MPTLRRLNLEHVQRRAQQLSQSRYFLVWLAIFSALECTILPIPLEVVLVPLMIQQRQRIWAMASAVLIGCIAGSMAGYLLGVVLFDTAGIWLVEQLNWQAELEAFRGRFEQSGFVAILAVGVLPIPFQLAMLVAGAAAYPWYLFLAAVMIARGLRYYGLASLVHLFGDQAIAQWQRHRRAYITLLSVGLLVWLTASIISS